MKYYIAKGNIIDVSVDAIVLPANEKLKMGSGASEAIFKAAGKSALSKACAKIGRCPMGFAVPTLAYNLDAKYIVHAVVPKWIDGEHKEYDLLSSTYEAALSTADAMGCKNIAFPLLASGNNGYELELALEIAIESINSYQTDCLEEAVIVIYGSHIAEIVKAKGLDAKTLVKNPILTDEEMAHFAARQKIKKDAKEVVTVFVEEQLQRGIDYFKNPDNREKAVKYGEKILSSVLEKYKSKSVNMDKNN